MSTAMLATPNPPPPKDQHPMEALADALGNLEYPVQPSDRWLRVLFTLLPCGLLVLASTLWDSGAPFLLTFAGAFASIQLVDPYRRVSTRFLDFLHEAREQDRTVTQHFRVMSSFLVSTSGSGAPGFSPLRRYRARLRFRRLGRRWKRNFKDASSRSRDSVTGLLSEAAKTRRGLEGNGLRLRWLRKWRAKRVLKDVREELLRIRGDGAPVDYLADQLELPL